MLVLDLIFRRMRTRRQVALTSLAAASCKQARRLPLEQPLIRYPQSLDNSILSLLAYTWQHQLFHFFFVIFCALAYYFFKIIINLILKHNYFYLSIKVFICKYLVLKAIKYIKSWSINSYPWNIIILMRHFANYLIFHL